jgi:hypothetical protein
MTTNTAAIQSLLRPGLADVFGDYPNFPSEWSEIFDKNTSDKAVEIDVEVKLLGLAAIKAEGASIAYQDMGQRFITNYLNQYTAIGFIITRQAMKDNLYKDRFPMQAKSLKDSLAQTKEIRGAAILNNGFDTAYPIGDGQPVFSLSHPIDGGTVANTFTVQTDLNESSLEDAITGIGNYKDVAGLRRQFIPQKLVVPNGGQFTAQRLLQSQFRTGTGNNDINAVYSMNLVPKGFVLNHYLTDTDAWFLMTNADNGFKYFEREVVETDVYEDFDSKSLKASAIERYSFGVSNFRAAWG